MQRPGTTIIAINHRTRILPAPRVVRVAGVAAILATTIPASRIGTTMAPRAQAVVGKTILGAVEIVAAVAARGGTRTGAARGMMTTVSMIAATAIAVIVAAKPKIRLVRTAGRAIRTMTDGAAVGVPEAAAETPIGTGMEEVVVVAYGLEIAIGIQMWSRCRCRPRTLRNRQEGGTLTLDRARGGGKGAGVGVEVELVIRIL